MKTLTISVLVLSTLFLGGCKTLTGEQRALVINQCPVLRQYTKQELQQAANELRGIPSDSQVASLLNDYSKLRDACRIAKRKLAYIRRLNNNND